MKSRMVTQEAVRRLYRYDPESGLFTRRVKTGSSTLVGEVVGSPAKSGYLRITVDGVRMLAHRAAWLYVTGKQPPDDIDHIDGDRQNNRLANLRLATRSENMQNERVARSSNKSSGLLGVSFHKGAGRWSAKVRKPGGEPVYLGLHDTPEAAHQAYLKAKRELHPFATI